MEIKLKTLFFFYRKKLLKIAMKSFVFLFCSLVFGVSPLNEVFSQNTKIKIDSDKVLTVDQVFELISDQTDYTFIYQVDMFKDFPKVDIKKGSILINKLLQKSLSQGEFQIELSANSNNVLIKEKPAPDTLQGMTATGTITDKNGMPIPGLSVYVTKDASVIGENVIRGTSTDFDGKFTLSVSPNDILVVTGIGYVTSKQIIASGKTIYDFILQDDVNELQEIVITGYQKIAKERSTGAFTTVKKEQIQNTVTQNIGSVLQGIAPGIQVVEDADGRINLDDIAIRGVGTISSNRAPLLVVDGFPINVTNFNTINPNDVESINILKDAAAASIWGARAANGVIVITTKKAKKGKLQVGFTSSVKMRPKMDLDRNITTADSKTQLAYEATVWIPGGHGTSSSFMLPYPAPNTLFDRQNVNRNGNTAYSQGARAYFDAYNGNITQAELNTIISRLSNNNSLLDAKQYLLEAPIQKQYNLSFGTSTENSNTRLSVLYNDNTGAFIGTEDNQLLINLNNQYKISDWLTLNISGMLDKSRRETAGIGFNTIQNLQPYDRLINEDGTYASVYHPTYDAKYLEIFANSVNGLPYNDITYNPLRDARDTEFVTKETNFRVSAGLDIKILDGLMVKPSFTYQKYDTNSNNYNGPETSYVKFQVINGFEIPNYDPVTGNLGESRIPTGAILDNSFGETDYLSLRNLITYDKMFGKHYITVLGGIERTSSTTKFTGGVRTYGFNKDNFTYAVPNNQPWQPIWGAGGVGDGRAFRKSDDRYYSYFGNFAYTYDGKYTISGSARSDGANFIVEDKSQRYNPMWSIGASWNISEENFLRDVDFVNRLKLRVTNGQNGNVVNAESTIPTISLSPSFSPVHGGFRAFLNGLGNPDLRWERVSTYNIGLDLDLFDSKLYGSIDYYNKASKDLIASVDTSPTTGFSSARYNVASMLNKGIEFDLSSDIRLSSETSFTTNVVFAFNDSEVTSLKDIQIFPRSLPNFPYIEGKPYQPIYSFVYGGMQTIPSQPKPYPTIIGENGETYGMDQNIGQNGEEGRDVLKFMGTRIAPTVIGWNNTFRFKNFTLSTRMTGKFGHKFVRPTFDYPVFLQKGGFHEDLAGLLTGNHDAMGLPKLETEWELWSYRWGWYTPNLDTLVEDAAHIRLRQVYFAYDMPRDVLSKIGISSLRLFAQAENLGNIWKANDYGIDPEYIEGVTRAPEKTFSLGLNIEF
ncbi:SusC/RagA family TonB-linked outer membrane protein [Sabulilitoribacter arenilitoris]|uniref:SusC/RagA family TonB-linked outer membrane protein n=1 Tax=Wocania arenilitoris TaxID=2044858 RepID=A0AAE3ENS8_9FLAO|nr:SusC/RagA family TonB-linked outer membrane protein [Wocania arenilitoris]MCF7568278.1 SusC/RagA family TonB-linked outer membrane protein [Wocania arenilitoris]